MGNDINIIFMNEIYKKKEVSEKWKRVFINIVVKRNDLVFRMVEMFYFLFLLKNKKDNEDKFEFVFIENRNNLIRFVVYGKEKYVYVIIYK